MALALVATAPASAANVTLNGGATILKLDKGTASALKSLGVSVSKTRGTQFAKGAYHFPVTGGVIDPATAAGYVNHKGGLALKAGKTRVALTNFRIVTTGTPRILANVNGGSKFVHVFNLNLADVKIKRLGINSRISGVKLSLSKTGASALRNAFGSPALTTGLAIGTANTLVKPRDVVYTGGGTELVVDGGTLAALTSLGIAPSAAEKSTLTGATYNFPISMGKLNSKTLAGTVDHTGGIVLTKGATVVTLSDFTIDTTKKQLWGKVNGSAPVALLDLDLTKLTLVFRSQKVWVNNVPAAFTAGAASALNAAFGTSAITAGLPLGVATIKGNTA
jgi:hypothetical protein